MEISAKDVFPLADLKAGLFIARIWRPAPVNGPSVVLLTAEGVFDLHSLAPTVSALLESRHLARQLREFPRNHPICSVTELVAISLGRDRTAAQPFLLAPCDLQVVKACGVTFAASTLERVVEERTKGDPSLAVQARQAILDTLGGKLIRIVPGSQEADQLKRRLIELGLWSQYLEVAIGPDAEVFTKAPPMSAIGAGADVGIHRMSSWNNPEPEVVIAVNSRGEAVGAALGNDVNLRDVEGRSALLLGRAKDNNGSCAIGPAIRIFDEHFTLDNVRQMEITLEVDGVDGFHLADVSSMREISRDPLDLVRQTIGRHHQYPDGVLLFLGTMFAPTKDRDREGEGFTHHLEDVVRISGPGLGLLMNRVNFSDAIPPWTYGIGQLLDHLRRRGK
jgi:fumarylacetoacetate (FAA) hydrolase family protein